MNKFIHSIVCIPLVFSQTPSWGTETEDPSDSIRENIAYTLYDPCAGKQKTEYLNCRLHQKEGNSHQNDNEIREIIRSARERWNLFLSSSLSLPLEVRERTTGRTPDGRILTESYTTPSFLPQRFDARFGLRSISFVYKTQFDLERILRPRTLDIPPPVELPPQSAVALGE